MNPFISFLISQGLPRETLSIIVFAPLLIALIVAARHIIGFQTFGVYAPFILTFALVQMGLASGLIVLAIIAGVGALLRMGLRNTALLHLPRIGLVMVGALAGLLALFLFQGHTGDTRLFALTPITFFAFLVLVEDFFSARIERRPVELLRYLGETLGTALAGYFLVTSRPLEEFFFAQPLFPFVSGVILLIFLGRWTGLRLGEYIRFRKLL